MTCASSIAPASVCSAFHHTLAGSRAKSDPSSGVLKATAAVASKLPSYRFVSVPEPGLVGNSSALQTPLKRCPVHLLRLSSAVKKFRPRGAAAPMASTATNQELIEVTNEANEKLVGVMEGESKDDVVILCHGFQSSKQSSTLQAIVPGLVNKGFGVLRFDFSGNGESGGEFEFGNYMKEVEDLRSVIEFVRLQKKRSVKAIVGHSKGGDVVILYAAKYQDVPITVNVSGRFQLSGGLVERLGQEGLDAISSRGVFDVRDSQGVLKYQVTKASLDERLSIDIEAAARSISENVRVLTVHGTADETIPVEDGKAFDRVVANHKLVLIEGADHRFSKHREELQAAVSEFISRL